MKTEKNMKDKLIELLEGNNSIEIVFKGRIPYLCIGTNEDYGVFNKFGIGDHNITGYNNSDVSQDTMNKIKSSIIEILKSEKGMENF